jgi:hypothetical protein
MTALKILRHGTHFTIGVKQFRHATVVASFGLPIGWEMAGIDTNVMRVVPDDWKAVIFDFTRTDFADSSMLGIVRTFWEETQVDPARRVFIVAQPDTTMYEKLVLTGISRRVPLVATVEDALAEAESDG